MQKEDILIQENFYLETILEKKEKKWLLEKSKLEQKIESLQCYIKNMPDKGQSNIKQKLYQKHKMHKYFVNKNELTSKNKNPFKNFDTTSPKSVKSQSFLQTSFDKSGVVSTANLNDDINQQNSSSLHYNESTGLTYKLSKNLDANNLQNQKKDNFVSKISKSLKVPINDNEKNFDSTQDLKTLQMGFLNKMKFERIKTENVKSGTIKSGTIHKNLPKHIRKNSPSMFAKNQSKNNLDTFNNYSNNISANEVTEINKNAQSITCNENDLALQNQENTNSDIKALIFMNYKTSSRSFDNIRQETYQKNSMDNVFVYSPRNPKQNYMECFKQSNTNIENDENLKQEQQSPEMCKRILNKSSTKSNLSLSEILRSKIMFAGDNHNVFKSQNIVKKMKKSPIHIFSSKKLYKSIDMNCFKGKKDDNGNIFTGDLREKMNMCKRNMSKTELYNSYKY